LLFRKMHIMNAYMHTVKPSMQTITALQAGRVVTVALPSAHERLGSGRLRWGSAELPMTPAYWAAQSWMWALEAPEHFRLGRSLAEELIACILGGYGIPAEVGLAAYDRLRPHLRDPDSLADERHVHELLLEPLTVGNRQVRYRFARQKAGYVAAVCRELTDIDDALPDRALRDRLMRLRGFGPKTASWVVRNWRASDEVAILDIHIIRAGNELGIFRSDWRVERHYDLLEGAYLEFAGALGVKASILDSVMWMTMRQLPNAPSPRTHGTHQIGPKRSTSSRSPSRLAFAG
jgi:thermostable 8-oxoguanine DNA glycosylase